MRVGVSSCVLMIAVAMRLAGQEPAQTQPLPQQAMQPAATGSVTGHVYLGDTRLPARMARVTLLPVGHANAKDEKSSGSSAEAGTGLDGSFAIPNVLPGNYYVIAQRIGYISAVPVSYDEFEHPTKDLDDTLASALTPVTVAANRTTTTDIALAKGAVISGTIRFDDGERDSGSLVGLLRKDVSGRGVAYAAEEMEYSPTNDRGDFRIAGLTAGEYVLKTTLQMQGIDVRNGGSFSSSGEDYSLDIYYGDKTRLKDAKSIKVKDGEESDGNDIEIPLAKLHSVSGTVISAATGETVKAAHVELHETDDDSLVAETATSGDDDEFHFPYVPEGEYMLKVRRVADVLLMNSAAPMPKGAREYEDASQAIVVHGEMSGVIVQVKPKAVGAAAQ